MPVPRCTEVSQPMSLLGHSRPMHLVPVPINDRCYSNSDIIVRRIEVTLRSSRPEESHPRALPDPCVNLSIHTAPDARPFPWHSCQ